MIRGKFQAQDNFDLAGHRLQNWKWLNDLPTASAEDGQILAYINGNVVWATATSGGVVSVDWNDITGKPSDFPPEDHSHSVSDITDFPSTWAWSDLTGVPTEFPPEDHTHVVTEITDFPTTWAWTDLTGVPDIVNDLSAGTGISLSATTGSVTVTCDLTWSELADKPASFNPTTHTHTVADVTNFPDTWAWTDLTGVPAEFPPEDHTHVVTDITDFPVNLVNTVTAGTGISLSNNTGDVTITNSMTWGTLPNKPTEFTPEDHTHVVTDITDFPTTWAWTNLTGVPSIVNSVSGGSNINVSTSTGDVVISFSGTTGGITAITAGTNISVNGSTVSVVDAPTFASTVVINGRMDLNSFADIAGEVYARANLRLNYGGPDGDAYLYFFEGSSSTGAYLKWDDSAARFEFNKNLYGAALIWAGGNLRADGALLVDDNAYLNYSGPDGDSYLYFYDNSSPTNRYLRWNNTYNRFDFSTSLQVQGSILCEGNAYLNGDGPDGDSYLYFYEGGSTTGAYLKWDNGTTRHEFSHAVYVTSDLRVGGSIVGEDDIIAVGDIKAQGNLMSRNNVYVNSDGADGDSYLYFYEGSSATGAYLQWDDSISRFVLSDGIDINGRVEINQGNANRPLVLESTDVLVGIEFIDSFANGALDYDGDNDRFLFYDGSDTLVCIIKDNAFTTNGHAIIGGRVTASGYADFAGDLFLRDNRILLNYNIGTGGNAGVYFRTGSVNEGAYLEWNETDGRFDINQDVDVAGTLATDGLTVDGDTIFSDRITKYDNPTINSNTPIDTNWSGSVEANSEYAFEMKLIAVEVSSIDPTISLSVPSGTIVYYNVNGSTSTNTAAGSVTLDGSGLKSYHITGHVVVGANAGDFTVQVRRSSPSTSNPVLRGTMELNKCH